MRVLFLASAALIIFSYAGYPICMFIRARFWSLAVLRADLFPKVTIVMAVRNEGGTLLKKLHNLTALQYPAGLLEIIVISDGSTDETNGILREWQISNARTVILLEPQGKASALNHGTALATGDIVCFTDARQSIASDGLKHLMMNFSDPSVGCASGELAMNAERSAATSEGIGLYWRLEKNIRNWEGLAGSTVGATGAFYAVRRELLVALPAGTILDDVYIPMQVARLGKRVVFDRMAMVWDDLLPSARQEFRRKVRTLVGNYQLLQLAPWLLTRSNPLRFEFVCHKLLRLLVPFALVGIFVSTAWHHQGIYGFILALQIVFYALAGLTILRAKAGLLARLSNIALAFLVLNTAAAFAFVYFVTGKKDVWVR